MFFVFVSYRVGVEKPITQSYWPRLLQVPSPNESGSWRYLISASWKEIGRANNVNGAWLFVLAPACCPALSFTFKNRARLDTPSRCLTEDHFSFSQPRSMQSRTTKGVGQSRGEGDARFSDPPVEGVVWNTKWSCCLYPCSHWFESHKHKRANSRRPFLIALGSNIGTSKIIHKGPGQIRSWDTGQSGTVMLAPSWKNGSRANKNMFFFFISTWTA